jgi:hypothetical protein
MPIRPFLDGHRFDAETTRLMGIARKTVVAALHTRADVKPPRSPYHHRSGENRRERPQASLRGGPESRAVYPIVNAPTPFRLTLHRRCCRIHELQPVRGGAGPVARSQPLRDNPIPIGRQHRPRSARVLVQRTPASKSAMIHKGIEFAIRAGGCVVSGCVVPSPFVPSTAATREITLSTAVRPVRSQRHRQRAP